MTFSFSGTFLDAEYDSFEGANGVGGPADLSGQRPSGVPEVATVFAASYTHPLSFGQAFLRADDQFESEVQVADNLSENVASRQIDVVNASIGVTMNNGFEVQLWSRNLFDDEFVSFAVPTTLQEGSFLGFPNQPRTYGATLRKTF